MSEKTATEFWKERFGEYPKTDSEKLACAMMNEYAESYKNLRKIADKERKEEHLSELRNQLEINIWRLLPDACKEILTPLKKSYIDAVCSEVEEVIESRQAVAKPLEWIEVKRGVYRAETLFGSYTIYDCSPADFDNWMFFAREKEDVPAPGLTVKQMQEKCQSHYDNLVSQCVSLTPLNETQKDLCVTGDTQCTQVVSLPSEEEKIKIGQDYYESFKTYEERIKLKKLFKESGLNEEILLYKWIYDNLSTLTTKEA